MSLVGVVALVIFGAIGIMHQQTEKDEIDQALGSAVNQSGMRGLPGLGFMESRGSGH